MRFKVVVSREKASTSLWIHEDDLEAMFTPQAQAMILQAYAKHLESKKKNE